MKFIVRLWLFVGVCLLVGSARAQVNPFLGAGGEGLADWSRSNVFVDLIKQSRGFRVSQPTGDRDATKDSLGWPTEDCYTLVHTVGLDTAATYNGVYRLSYNGSGTTDLWWSIGGSTITNYKYDSVTDKTTYDVTLNYQASDNDGYLVLRFSNTQGKLKNIRLIRPGYSATEPPIFTNEFKNHAKRFSTFRFMDWTSTNNQIVGSWSQRTLPTAPSYAVPSGIPWETCIQLCNELNRDAWINVPILANDDYVQKLAKLFKASLKPGLKLYLEYSNEIWNFGFQQFGQNTDLTLAELNAGGSDLIFPGEDGKDANGEWTNKWTFVFRRIAKRLLQIRNIFASEYGEAAMNDMVRPVYASQVVNPYLFQVGLEWMNRRGYFPGRFFYALSGAPYFSLGTADEQTNLTKTQVLDALALGVNEWFTEYSGGAKALEVYRAESLANGLKFLAYEGGPDTFGPHNIVSKKAASLDSRMADISEDYLDRWYKAGGDLFMWFVMGATNYDSQYGTWGLTNDMRNQAAPKVLAMDRVLGRTRPNPTIGPLLPGLIDARRFAGANGTWSADNPYLRWFGAGAKYDYLFRVSSAGRYAIRFTAATEAVGKKAKIWINSTDAGEVTFPKTGGNETWVTGEWLPIKIPAGLNNLRVVFADGGLNVKTIEVVTLADAYQGRPTNLKADAAGNRRIQLTWTMAAGANSYNIYRSLTPITSTGAPFQTGVARTKWLDSTVENGKRYYYRVTAIIKGVESPFSNEVSAKTASVNLLRNGDFEFGILTGWLGGGWQEATDITPYAGTYASRINGGWASLYQSASGFPSGRYYKLSAYGKSLKSTVKMYYKVYYEGGTSEEFTASVSGNTYKRYEIRRLLGSNVDRVEVGFYDSDGGTGYTYFDNFVFAED